MPSYEAVDELHLWWLGNPASPQLVGKLRLVSAGRAVSLQYGIEWLRHGFALSEDLPLIDHEHVPTERDTAAGAVDDARPDRWGERVIRLLDKPPRLSILEYLYFAGDERFGALGVSISDTEYLPKMLGPLPKLEDVGQIQELIRKVKANEPVPEKFRRLIAPGVTMGGMRPKGLVQIEDEQWVVKFREEDDPTDAPLVEHACMTLASKAGIRVATTRAIPVSGGHAVAVKRFDREGQTRLHALSAKIALRAESEEPGYPELALLLRRRGPTENGVSRAQMRELFRRLIFNILMDNTDDHERNHVVLMDDAQHLTLSPAFDVSPTCQSLGYQQMRVGVDQNDSTVFNAMSEAARYGISPKEATIEARNVALVCASWRRHFQAAKVKSGDLEFLSNHIDRNFLKDQRDELQH